MAITASSALRWYLLLVGVGLLVQGIISIVLSTTGIAPPAFTLDFLRADPLHGAIHIAWGLVLLLPLLARWSDRRLALLAVCFGGFYVLFGLAGIVIHYPLGMRLDPGENGFHLIVGPLGLLLGTWALVADRASAVADGG